MNASEPFLDRSLSPVILAALEDTPVVILLGSRQCGKTTLVRRIAPDRAFVSLDDGRLHQAALDDPDRFVEGLPPFVTIDEVQRALALLSAIKRSADEDRRCRAFKRLARSSCK